MTSLLYDHTCGNIVTGVALTAFSTKTSLLMAAGQPGLKSPNVVLPIATEDTKFITDFVTCQQNFMVAEIVQEKELRKRIVK